MTVCGSLSPLFSTLKQQVTLVTECAGRTAAQQVPSSFSAQHSFSPNHALTLISKLLPPLFSKNNSYSDNPFFSPMKLPCAERQRIPPLSQRVSEQPHKPPNSRNTDAKIMNAARFILYHLSLTGRAPTVPNS